MGWLERLARILLLLVLVYFFLAAIELFGTSFKIVGKETAQGLFEGLQNPFAGLAVGILATVMVQSSSVTTSTVVAMVGATAAVGSTAGGETTSLSLELAVPMIMGANIGTSITNTLVALGHVRQDEAFRRAFAGATVHDIFNLLTTAILFPIELATGFLRNSATWLVEVLPLNPDKSVAFKSPIKTAVKAAAGQVEWFFGDLLGLEAKWLAAALCAAALALIVFSLIAITKNMKLLIADRIEELLNRVLGRSGLLAIGVGAIITMLVQSSSITTSLLVPMFGAGVLRLEAGFPVMLGANIGTTITALLAASVTGPAGLTIAIVHTLFNIAGTLMFYPVRALRRIPIGLSEALASLAVRNRVWVGVYVLGVFVFLPLVGVLIWR